MHKLEKIAEHIRQKFDVRTSLRDQALAQARQLTRACSLAIRAVHRDDQESMETNLTEAKILADKLRSELGNYPDLFYAGYTQDALKEFVEANVTCALIQSQPLLTPEELGVDEATYLNGLAEVVGELRRRILDILRHGYSQEAERLLIIWTRSIPFWLPWITRMRSPTDYAVRPTWRAVSSKRHAVM